MDRRAFLLLTLAGIADPGGSSAPTASQVGAGAGDLDTLFDAWMADYTARAVAGGAPAEVVRREFAGLTPDPQVVALDGRQAEFSKPIGAYVQGVVTEGRIAEGAAKRETLPGLAEVEARYGVPAQVLIAIWAVESGFGAVQGQKDVLRSLASLAAAGRRRGWAEGQLGALITIIAEGRASRPQLKGSWAGAMGQTQLEPDAFLTYAVDGADDGRPADIWDRPLDALASAAHLLAHDGWRPGERWDCEVILPPGFDYGLAEGPAQTPDAWAEMGAVRADGQTWNGRDAAAPAQLILPAGARGPAFLTFPNHGVIRQYNNSTAYALSVGLLADRIAGAGPLKTPWPVETSLSLADRLDAQNALTKLGFNPGPVDAMIGYGTRVALRAWQKSRGLPADGYLSPQVLNQLRIEAGLVPGPPT
ncbi:MAG: lytic murein transglycosylase [Caulobacteraceae bacterium]|nr:lytic murein transglycosylase [Caulobacteraceae bacterium]